MAFEGKEKRKHPRLDFNLIVSYRPLENTEKMRITQIKNLSRGGMMISTCEKIEKGTMLKINLRFPLLKKKVNLVGKVIESKEVVPNFDYETRVYFYNMDKEVEKLLHDSLEDFKNHKNAGKKN